MTSFILLLCCLFLNVTGSNNVYDLQGKTYRISDGDVSMLDGREIKNGKFVISEGDYFLQVKNEKGACLIVGDNIELIIDGTLQLSPNGFKSYDMIRVVGRNVTIHGKGKIIGDRFKHLGSEGQWGMGINLKGVKDVTIKDITIRECWGDCIYIGGNSSSVRIENCILDNSRRQGVSITKADGVTITNCTISNIHGTNPQYAIDVEPNEKCTVDHVLINNIDIVNCEGGIRATVPNKGIGNAKIGRVEILNSRVTANTRYPIHLNRCQQGIVERCTIEGSNEKSHIYANYIDDLKVSDNTLNVKVQLLSSVVNKAKEMVGKAAYSTIRVVHTSARKIENNKVIEK